MAGPGTDSKSLEKRHDIVESKQWVVAAHLSNSDEKSPKSTVMRVHLINPSDTSFGIAVITPRWLYVLAAATPATFGDPVLCDETLRPLMPGTYRAAMWLESEFTLATHCAAMPSVGWHGSAGRG